MSERARTDCKFIMLGVPDVHGALRGKVLTAEEFHLVAERGSSPFSDLVLALDPADQPITSCRSSGSTPAPPTCSSGPSSTRWPR